MAWSKAHIKWKLLLLFSTALPSIVSCVGDHLQILQDLGEKSSICLYIHVLLPCYRLLVHTSAEGSEY